MARSITSFVSSRFNATATMPRSIRAMRAVSIAGIAISVAALVIATSIGRGFEKHYRRALMDFNAHVVVMGSAEIERPEEVHQVLDQMPQIVAVTPFVYREGLAIGGGNIRGVVIKGIDPPTMRDVNSMSIKLFGGAETLALALYPSGEGVTPVIAGKALAADLGVKDSYTPVKLLVPREEARKPKGDQFDELNIVGTFESGMHDYDAQFMLMSLPDIRRMFGINDGVVSGIELKLADAETAGDTAASIEKSLGPRYTAITWSELNRDLLIAVRLEKLMSAIIMGIMVVVAVLNIVAVLVLTTIHRLREISVLKAIGLSDRGVSALLARGGAMVGFTGVVIGMVVGIAAAWTIGCFDLIPLEAEIYLIEALPIDISPLICGMIAVFCLMAGFLASTFASRRLATVPVAEGLMIAR